MMRGACPDRPETAGDTIAWLAAKRREWLGEQYMSCPWDIEGLMEKKDKIMENDTLELK